MRTSFIVVEYADSSGVERVEPFESLARSGEECWINGRLVEEAVYAKAKDGVRSVMTRHTLPYVRTAPRRA